MHLELEVIESFLYIFKMIFHYVFITCFHIFKFANIYIPHLFARPAKCLIQAEGTGDANSEVLLAWFHVETVKPIRFASF